MTGKSDFAFWSFMTMASLACVTTVFNVSRTYSATTTNPEIFSQLDLFGDVIDRVRADYVEKPDDAMLVENAIHGMLAALDPHSAYLTPEHFHDMQVQTRGEFGGLGIEVTTENGVVKVVSPIDDTPAALAGVQANDLITHLDNEQIVGLTLQAVIDKMRGPVNTPVTLTVVRKGRNEPFDIKLTRDIIKIQAMKSRLELNGEAIYTKIAIFNEQTHSSLEEQIEALKKLTTKTIKGYIVDLRNNPGGLLDQAVAVSDDFLEKGVIVLMKGRNLEETQRSEARPGDITDGKRIIVLINGGSASASEIVAGALQDHKRATVIGTRSFGKGSVQTIIPLGQNGALRLTTARYYTPSGRSIQAKGIEPDIIVEQDLPDDLRGKDTPRGEASLRGHLKNDLMENEQSGSSAYVPSEPEKDVQLQYALAMLRDGTDMATLRATPGPTAPPAATPEPEKKAN